MLKTTYVNFLNSNITYKNNLLIRRVWLINFELFFYPINGFFSICNEDEIDDATLMDDYDRLEGEEIKSGRWQRSIWLKLSTDCENLIPHNKSINKIA